MDEEFKFTNLQDKFYDNFSSTWDYLITDTEKPLSVS